MWPTGLLKLLWVRLWLAKKRWLQAIHAVRSINICGKIIEDIREEKRRKEMERRMRDEAYQVGTNSL